jgi:hypothetical protein
MSNMDYHGEFLKWATTKAVGCHFARTLARNTEGAKWGGALIRGNDIDVESASVLNAYLSDACDRLEAIHVLFPDINGAKEIVPLIHALCATPNWKCVEIASDCPHANQHLLVGLRWFLPDDVHVNYVLGFGKFEPMPRTRHAPFTALALRPGPPGIIPGTIYKTLVPPKDDVRRPDMGRIPVHLADMKYPLAKDEEQIRSVWRNTSELKAEQLRGDDMAKAAKAKITFCLPSALRKDLSNVLSEVVSMPAAVAM